jgi:hypothetical protein
MAQTYIKILVLCNTKYYKNTILFDERQSRMTKAEKPQFGTTTERIKKLFDAVGETTRQGRTF